VLRDVEGIDAAILIPRWKNSQSRKALAQGIFSSIVASGAARATLHIDAT